jgi:multiple sugar transport system substrate-binding protein
MKQNIVGWIGIILLVGLGLVPGCKTPQPEPVTITISAGSTGEAGNAALEQQAQQFMDTHPNINVEVILQHESTDAQHDFYLQEFKAGSPDIDIPSIDIIWPPEFGEKGLTRPLDAYVAEYGIDIDAFLPGTIRGNTWDGQLVAMPHFTAAGMLYYRQDLLDQYGFAPPETWAELVHIAQTIVTRERETSPGLVGFVYQADRYEGLVCNYLEYVWGNGADVLNAEGDQVVLNTPQAVEGLAIFAAMQAIAPTGILTFKEEDALNYFAEGNAVFMRNWPYAWFILNQDESPVKGQIQVTSVPRGPQGTVGVSTLGGWQLGINAHSEHPDEAFALIAFLTSLEQQNYAAIQAAHLPTRKQSYQDRDVLVANPFMRDLADVLLNAKPRPVHPLYAEAISPIIQEEVHRVLRGEEDAVTATEAMASRIQAIIVQEE